MLWLLVVPAVYLLLLLGVAYFSLHPVRMPIFFAPGTIGAPQEAVEFANPSGHRLRGWWIEPDPERLGANTTVAVFCHGYMMNRSELAPVAYSLWRTGRASLLFDFRAHGRSGGKKSGLGWYEREDVAAACRYVRSRFPDARIVLVGSSMGSAAAALALGEDPSLAEALVLDSSYSTLASAVTGWWRFLGGNLLAFFLAPTALLAAPMAGFSPYRVKVSEALARTTQPVLLMHGDCDTLALPSEAVANLEALGDRAEVVWFDTCGHSEGRWLQPQRYMGALMGFLDRLGL